MAVANSMLLLAGLALEGLLLTMLWRRRLAARLWFFAMLLLFYAVRAVLLYATAGRISPGAHMLMGSAFAVVDPVAQVTLATVLYLRVRKPARGDGRKQALSPGGVLALLGLLVASALTMLLVWLTQVYTPAPVDRGVVFCGLLFAVFWGMTVKESAPGPERLLLRGFAVQGFAAVASQAGRAVAAAHRNPHLFLFWAYMDVAVWLFVLLVWIFGLGRAGVGTPGVAVSPGSGNVLA